MINSPALAVVCLLRCTTNWLQCVVVPSVAAVSPVDRLVPTADVEATCAQPARPARPGHAPRLRLPYFFFGISTRSFLKDHSVR